MFNDKYQRIFSHQMGAIVFMFLQMFFRNTSAFKNNLRDINQIFPSFSYGLFSHAAHLEQSHKQKYLRGSK